jgi:hypothetical protein
MTEGSISSGSYSTTLNEICNNVEIMSINQSTTSKPQVPAKPTARDIGRKRTFQFLDDIAKEAPTKSRRLEIVQSLDRLEKERVKAVNRRDKKKQRMRELAAGLEDDESQIAELDEQIRRLKAERVE